MKKINLFFMSHQTEIDTLAEQDSLEAIQKLVEIINAQTITADEFESALGVLNLVLASYIIPDNEAEEEDLKICRMIAKRVEYIKKRAHELCEKEDDLEDRRLEFKIANRMYERAPEEQKEDRRIDVSVVENLLFMDEKACSDIEEEMNHDQLWIDAARDILTTEKFRSLPNVCFEGLVSWNGEDDWETDFDGEDGLEDCLCVDCGRRNVDKECLPF